MQKVFSGAAFKKWFNSNHEMRRVLTPSRDSFHLLSHLDEIHDNKYYIVKDRNYGEVIIEEVQFMG